MTNKMRLELYDALKIFAAYKQGGKKSTDIKQLSKAGLISYFVLSGWFINEKGRQHLSEHSKYTLNST